MHLVHAQTDAHLSLEGAVERCEEVRARGKSQDPPLHQGALRVLVLEENVFLQHFDGEQPLAASLLCQQHLYRRRERRERYCNNSKIQKILKELLHVCMKSTNKHNVYLQTTVHLLSGSKKRRQVQLLKKHF